MGRPAKLNFSIDWLKNWNIFSGQCRHKGNLVTFYATSLLQGPVLVNTAQKNDPIF